MKTTPFTRHIIAGLSFVLMSLVPALAQNPRSTPTPPTNPEQAKKPADLSGFPSADKVLKDYRKIPPKDGTRGFFTIYKRDKDDHTLAELPKDFARQRHFIALTVARGESYAGLQSGDMYVYWQRFNNNRLALIQPNLETRSTGDAESKSSVDRLFTDRVLLDVPIVTFIPKGGPVIDLDNLLVANASKFFGRDASGINPKLFKLRTAKTFPQNIEVAYEVPMAGGILRTLHYSISLIKPNKEYKPRVADERVGFFTTSYQDFGQFKHDKVRTRYINRWHLEKADPGLKLSPPKKPIVFYIEHTTPVRYRRWVADGLLMWNKAYEKVGLVNAIEVRFQDAKSGAYMDLDPEDVRYNFIRWLNNGIGTAIGPSRVNPETGQILDADIVLTDGWIRHWWTQYNEILPDLAMEGYSPTTMAWLEKHSQWDPRVRLASPSKRSEILRLRAEAGPQPMGGHPAAKVESKMMGDQEFDGLTGRVSQVNGFCMAANCKTHALATMHMQMEIARMSNASAEGENKDGEKKEEKPKKDGEQMIDGIPESFIGPLMADLVAHEVGHTLGLRHNFKASSVYTLDEINSEEIKGKKPFASSVMDYIPINMRINEGSIQGDYAMIGIGPYDMWAIEYGYTFAKDLKPILARSAEPELQYCTDEDTWGPDPLARRYDFSKNPLDYAKNQINLVKEHRSELLEKFVQDGESWAKVRRGYLLTLSTQTKALSMMANWVGGSHVNRHRKGDPNGKAPIEVVPASTQRDALKFVIDNAFSEKAFGLTPEILRHMTVDKWWDGATAFEDPTWPVHDRVLGIQASALTSVLNPGTLEGIYDNELRLAGDEDTLTLPELLDTLSKSVWSELEPADEGQEYTVRKPMISSLRRNLQREYLDRLSDLISPNAGFGAAYKPISDLANMELRTIKDRIEKIQDSENLDAYSRAHLREAVRRIEKALDASIVLEIKG